MDDGSYTDYNSFQSNFDIDGNLMEKKFISIMSIQNQEIFTQIKKIILKIIFMS